jgi:glycosyltransferase involved in cell wall biosynthesis
MQPKVTVVITSRNRLAYLREAVASVREQEGVAHELILVDHGSTDGTAAWVSSLAGTGVTTRRVEHDPDRPRAANISVARNAGLESAVGEYVWFLDDDDRLRPGALSLLASALDQHPQAVAAIGARMRFRDEELLGRIAHPLRRLVRDLREDFLMGWGFIPGQSLCRASALRAAGGWREDVPWAEDLDMLARLLPRGPVVLEPETVLEYRVHRSQSRLANPAAEHDRLMRPYVTELARGDRAHGEVLRKAGRWWEQANQALAGGEPGKALGYTLRAAFLSPKLLRSPVLGPLALRMIVRSALRRLPLPRRATAHAPRPAGERPRRGTGYLS